jgi:hypothetical protein
MDGSPNYQHLDYDPQIIRTSEKGTFWQNMIIIHLSRVIFQLKIIKFKNLKKIKTKILFLKKKTKVLFNFLN